MDKQIKVGDRVLYMGHASKSGVVKELVDRKHGDDGQWHRWVAIVRMDGAVVNRRYLVADLTVVG